MPVLPVVIPIADLTALAHHLVDLMIAVATRHHRMLDATTLVHLVMMPIASQRIDVASSRRAIDVLVLGRHRNMARVGTAADSFRLTGAIAVASLLLIAVAMTVVAVTSVVVLSHP